MYKIDDYSDTELFQLMDLDSPSDRELEMKIHMLMNKYETMDNEIGREMYDFFLNVYNHFFENEEDQEGDEKEGFQNIVYDDSSKKNIKPSTTD